MKPSPRRGEVYCGLKATFPSALELLPFGKKEQKVWIHTRHSEEVSHLRTTRARTGLTSMFGWE